MILKAAVLFLHCLACTGLGLALLESPWFKRGKDLSPILLLATSFLLGEGLIAHAYVGLGLAGHFSLAWIATLELAALVLASRPFLRVAPRLFRQVTGLVREWGAEPWEWKLLGAAMVILGLAGVLSLGKSILGDAAAFYMVLPKVMASSHRLFPLPGFDTFSSIGLQGEMHFAALMALGNEDGARLLPWLNLLAAGALLAGICGHLGGGFRERVLALIMLFSSTSTLHLLGDGKVDFFSTAFGVAGVYWALSGCWGLTGLFGGLAILAKFSYIPVLIPLLGVLWLWQGFWLGPGDLARKDRMLRMARQGAIAGFWLVAMLVPQLVKNWILFRNPIAPFTGTSLGWTAQVWYGPETTRRILLTYPLALTFGNYFAQYGTLSPLILGFMPFAARLGRPPDLRRSPLTMLSVAACVGLLAWMIANPSVLCPRYIFADLLMLIPVAAFAGAAAIGGSILPRVAKWIVTAAVFAYLVLAVQGLPGQGLHWSLARQYVGGTFGGCDRDGIYCKAVQGLNQRAPANSRIYQLTYYTYWLRPDLLEHMATDEDFGAIDRLSGAAAWKALRDSGFKYLITDSSTHSARTGRLGLDHLPRGVRLTKIFEASPLAVYRIRYGSALGR